MNFNSKRLKRHSFFFRDMLATRCSHTFDQRENGSMTPLHRFGRCFRFAASFLLVTGLLPSLATPVFAQYTVTNLVSNQTAIGANPADPALVNAWGTRRRSSSKKFSRSTISWSRVRR